MTHAPVKVVAVIPVHNRREITLQCLRSLHRADKTGFDLEVIVVDDGSTDRTSYAINAEFPNTTIIAGDGDLWYTEATNVGIREAIQQGANYLLLMNDDQVFDPGFLRYLLATAKELPRSVV